MASSVLYQIENKYLFHDLNFQKDSLNNIVILCLDIYIL